MENKLPLNIFLGCIGRQLLNNGPNLVENLENGLDKIFLDCIGRQLLNHICRIYTLNIVFIYL